MRIKGIIFNTTLKKIQAFKLTLGSVFFPVKENASLCWSNNLISAMQLRISAERKFKSN